MMQTSFLRQQFTLFNVFNIPLRIDYRWFFVFVLLSLITAAYVPSSVVENNLYKILLGFVTTLIFFVSIFLHELAHAVVARMEKVEVLEIVLHPFGGMARFRRAPDTPQAEFRIAIAGPAASFLLAILFLLLTAGFNQLGENVVSPLFFLLFLWNLLLAVFNLFPGYPLDGGRVLRSYLWKRGKDLNESTVLTGQIGQIIGMVMMFFGFIITFIRGDLFTGLWTVVIGIFLFIEAKKIIAEIVGLRHIAVSEVMSPPVKISPEENILHFVDHVLPISRQTVFPVARDRELLGFLLLEDLKKIEREKWRDLTVGALMRELDDDYLIEPTASVEEARILMQENQLGILAVVNDYGEIVGFLQKGRIRKPN